MIIDAWLLEFFILFALIFRKEAYIQFAIKGQSSSKPPSASGFVQNYIVTVCLPQAILSNNIL